MPLKLLLAGGAIVVAVAYLVVVGLQSSTSYFYTVSELQAHSATASSSVVRVSGTLVPGTLTRDVGGTSVHFAIADPGAATAPLAVVYHGGQVPDIMGDNIEIVAEGKLDAQGSFTANNVLAKCPSRLENAPPVEHDYAAG
jgi:cytochrome c-type biogenesis protein CcmE